MSPRGFKIGLALFLAMSGLFVAKLVFPAGGVGTMVAASWNKTTALLASRSATTSPPETHRAAQAPTPPARPNSDEVRVATIAESAAHTAPPLAESDPALVGAIKLELKTRGYDVGSSGDLDLHARAAIMAFEADNDLRLTAEASQALLHRLLLGATSTEAHSGSPPSPRAEDVIRAVQSALQKAGHPDQKVDGTLSRETVETIRSFERAHNLKVSGRVSGELVGTLQRVARDGPLAAR